jgi:glutaredoxin 2
MIELTSEEIDKLVKKAIVEDHKKIVKETYDNMMYPRHDKMNFDEFIEWHDRLYALDRTFKASLINEKRGILSSIRNQLIDTGGVSPKQKQLIERYECYSREGYGWELKIKHNPECDKFNEQ